MGRKTQQNDITSPELLEKVSDENKQLVQEFKDYLVSIDRSPTTLEGYSNDLDIFMVWNLLNNNNKFFVNLTKREITKFQSYLLTGNKNSPNRIRRIKSTLSSLSNFIERVLDEDYPQFKNIINKIESPIKQEVREKTVLTDEQVDFLLDYLVDHKKYKQACAFALAVCSGSRKSELSRFKVSYFDDENIIYGSLYQTPEKIKTKGRSSQGKPLTRFVLRHKFKKYLDLWIEEREKLGVESEYLLVNKEKDGTWKPVPNTSYNSWTITFSKILGVDFYWHANRHYFTTHLKRLNIPDSVIQEIIGWESADMVKIYNDQSVDEQLGKYFDENGVKQVEAGSLDKL
jgi:integrase